jgi:methionine sulfoxide reductase catalytic subunit
MSTKLGDNIKASEITDYKVYLNRRNFMRGAALAASATATTFLYRKLNPPPAELPKGQTIETVATKPADELAKAGFTVNETQTPLEDITNYNNFYEFSTDKREVAAKAKGFVTRPWAVEVGGLVKKPKVFDLDELSKFAQEERVYRFRCVEGWSMVIPWIGFRFPSYSKKLSRCLKLVTSVFKPCTIDSACPISAQVFSNGRTSKD